MAIDKVRAYFRELGIEEKIMEFSASSATVSLAAEALHCEEKRIAKTLSFRVGEKVVLVVMAGDAKVDNSKFKQFFNQKPKMLALEEAEQEIGHAVGGVCPFAIRDRVEVYLDASLKRFDTVFPACGSENSAIELTIAQLEEYAQNVIGWVDVGKAWQEG